MDVGRARNGVAARALAFARGPLARVAGLGPRTSVIAAGALAAGAALRVGCWAAGGSMWLDELALSHNVLTRGLGELVLRPLELDQVAPAGFLVLQKLVVLVAGRSEHALRAVSLCASIASLLLFHRVSRRLLGRTAATFAIVLFAFTPGLVLYAAEAKQYATDVLASIVLTDLAVGARGAGRGSWRRCLAWCGAGAACFAFSYAAAIVFAAHTTALLVLAVRSRRWGELARLTAASALFGAAAGAIQLLHLQSVLPDTLAYLGRFWAHGFMPLELDASVLVWPWRKLADAFLLIYLYPAPSLYAALVFVGVAASWRRRRLLLFASGPLAAALAASAARQYPFAIRQLLFLAPQLLLLLAAVVDTSGALVRRAVRARGAPGSSAGRAVARVAPATIAALLLAPLGVRLAAQPPTAAKQELRKVFAYVQRHKAAGDLVYVYYPGWLATAFYGLADADTVVGGCHRREPFAYLAEIQEAMRGRSRVWVVSTLEFPSEGLLIRRYLADVGARRDGIFIPGNAAFQDARADLFEIARGADLAGARDGLRETAAASAPLWLPLGTDCDGGPHMPPSHRLQVLSGRSRG